MLWKHGGGVYGRRSEKLSHFVENYSENVIFKKVSNQSETSSSTDFHLHQIKVVFLFQCESANKVGSPSYMLDK